MFKELWAVYVAVCESVGTIRVFSGLAGPPSALVRHDGLRRVGVVIVDREICF